MLVEVFLCLLSASKAFQPGEQCNILKDERDVLYHPTEKLHSIRRSLHSVSEPDTDTEGSGELRQTLLAGLTEFPLPGTPGSFVVVNDDIEVIMAGPELWKINMVAGTYGQGRVVAFSHDGYIREFNNQDASSNFKVLKQNCYKWVTKGGYSSDWNIIGWDERAKLASADVSNTLAFIKISDSEEDPQETINFVNRGGSLIVVVNPWAQGDKEDLYKMYFQKLAVKMGFYFAPYYASVSNIADNKASKAHFGRTLNKIKIKPNEVTDTEWQFAKDEISSMWSFDILSSGILQEVMTLIKPNLAFPVEDKSMLYYLVFMSRIYKYGHANLGKAPAIHFFPFDFVEKPPIVDSLEKVLQASRKMHHSTGYYLPAGCEVEVIGTGLGKWWVRVGAADDDLSNKEKLFRWPEVMVEKRLSETGGRLYSPYGGSVYLWSPEGEHTITYQLKGVVESPQFNLSDPESMANWNINKNKPGLWADFFSDKIMITLPSVSVRDLDDPSVMLKFWTTLCQHFEDLRGEMPFIWFAPDVQISAGYMHAGYPIATQLDVTNPYYYKFLMRERITEVANCGAWGPYHEIGHNLQINAWNFQGCGEVTNNIFSMYGYTKMQQVSPWDSCWLDMAHWEGWKKYLDGGAKFDKDVGMNDYGTQLIIFAQMARDFGYDAYCKIFKLFDAGEKPSKYQARIDLWVKYMSTVTGKNIAAIFDFWGIPVSEDIWKTYANLTVYQPQDLVTEAYPERMTAAVTKAASYA